MARATRRFSPGAEGISRRTKRPATGAERQEPVPVDDGQMAPGPVVDLGHVVERVDRNGETRREMMGHDLVVVLAA